MDYPSKLALPIQLLPWLHDFLVVKSDEEVINGKLYNWRDPVHNGTKEAVRDPNDSANPRAPRHHWHLSLRHHGLQSRLPGRWVLWTDRSGYFYRYNAEGKRTIEPFWWKWCRANAPEAPPSSNPQTMGFLRLWWFPLLTFWWEFLNVNPLVRSQKGEIYPNVYLYGEGWKMTGLWRPARSPVQRKTITRFLRFLYTRWYAQGERFQLSYRCDIGHP